MIVLALTFNGHWALALAIAFGAAVAVAILLTVLTSTVDDIDRSVSGLLETAGRVAANTSTIPQLEATAPVLGQIMEEATVQDSYMNALTDGYGGA